MSDPLTNPTPLPTPGQTPNWGRQLLDGIKDRTDPLRQLVTQGRLSPESLSTTIATETVAPARAAAVEYIAEQGEVVDAAAARAVTVSSEAAVSALTRTGKRPVGRDELVFNVLDYGATGDGITDATAGVRAAINAANAAGGGTVHFPAGTYKVTERFSLRSGVRITGRGSSTTILKAAAPFTPAGFMFYAAPGTSHVTIEDLTLDASSLDPQGVIWLDRTTDITVQRCLIKAQSTQSAGNHGVSIAGCQRVTVADNEIVGTLSGVGVNNGGDTINILRNHIHGVGHINIRVIDDDLADRVTRLTIDGNRVDGASHRGSLIFIGASQNTFLTTKYEHVQVTNNIGTGKFTSFLVGNGNADLFSLRGMKTAVVSGNRVEGGGDLGMVIEWSEDVTVTGNIVRRNEISGIVIHRSHRVSVVGNTCVDNCTDTGAQAAPDAVRGGIRVLNGSSFVTLEGNTCTDSRPTATKTQLYGIALWHDGGTALSNITVGRNNLAGNKWGGLYTDNLGIINDNALTISSKNSLPMEHVPAFAYVRVRTVQGGDPAMLIADRSGQSVLDTAAAAGATQVTSAGVGVLTPTVSVVGVRLDNGQVHFATVAAQSGATLTLSAALPSAAAAGSLIRFNRYRTIQTY